MSGTCEFCRMNSRPRCSVKVREEKYLGMRFPLCLRQEGVRAYPQIQLDEAHVSIPHWAVSLCERIGYVLLLTALNV